MFLYVRGSVCVRAPTAPVAGPGEALWEKEVTGGRGLWGCSESRVVENGKCWAHAGTGEPLSRTVHGQWWEMKIHPEGCDLAVIEVFPSSR